MRTAELKGYIRRKVFNIKNTLPARRFLEGNRWLVALYFDWRYRSSDPYNYETIEGKQEKRRQAARMAGDRRYRRILETACGEGFMTEMLAPLGESLLGIDISGRALARAKRRLAGNPSVSFLRSDVLNFSSGEKFDLIVCSEVLYYMSPDQAQRAARKLVEYLVPGGRLLAVNIFSRAEAGHDYGAETVHPMLKKIPGLKQVKVKTSFSYEILLLEKKISRRPARLIPGA